MKPIVLVVQIALVVAGLVVYDTLRHDSPAPLPAVDVGHAVDRPASPAPAQPAPAASSPGVLQGAALESLRSQVADLQKTVRDMNKRLKEVASAGVSAGGPPAPLASAPADPVPTDGDTGAPPPVREQDIAWFREVQTVVQDRMRRERLFTMYDKRIDRIGVDLSEEQKKNVIEATIDYNKKFTEAAQASAAAREDATQRQTRMEAVHQEYQQKIYSLVPSGDAEKLVQQLAPYRGYGLQPNLRTLRSGR